MGKFFKVVYALFGVIGILATAGVGYVYATNSELVGEFWSVKDDFKAVPVDRREEVIAELPARITFEREVRQDMAELPDDRQTELYDQLAKSRDTVFDQFKQRIHAEAEIARKAKEAKQSVAEVSKTIEKELGKVSVDVDLTQQPKAHRVDNLSGVNTALGDVSKARLGYGEAMDRGGDRVAPAVNVLKALDRLGNEVQAARRKQLASSEQDRLTDVVRDAKATLYDVKQTPGLSSDPAGMKLLKSVPTKFNE